MLKLETESKCRYK